MPRDTSLISDTEKHAGDLAAVISDCTVRGTCNTSSLHFCTAPASSTSCLFRSEDAAKFRSVEIA